MSRRRNPLASLTVPALVGLGVAALLLVALAAFMLSRAAGGGATAVPTATAPPPVVRPAAQTFDLPDGYRGAVIGGTRTPLDGVPLGTAAQ